MNRWSDALAELQRSGEAHVIVTVIGTRGSTPRAAGSKMIVTAEQSYDSIGGGQLEYKAIEHARTLLLQGARQGADSQSLLHFPLSASLGQCCGGQATLLFEQFVASGAALLVFGAGHVARALIPILAGLPLRVSWIDNRDDPFPETVPTGVRTLASDDPVEGVETAPAGSYLLILTHNHQLDYELCEAALKRDDLGFVGVIGSATKATRFRQRLAHRGIDAARIEQLRCPVGLAGVPGKRPMEVAVSIAAQLIATYQRSLPQPMRRQGLDWRELQQLMHEPRDAAAAPVTHNKENG